MFSKSFVYDIPMVLMDKPRSRQACNTLIAGISLKRKINATPASSKHGARVCADAYKGVPDKLLSLIHI